jgi:arylformamidase
MDPMAIWDLTQPLRPGMVVFPGDPPFERRVLRRLEAGDPFTLSWLGMSAHAGTHVDPPAHFVAGGATVDRIPLDALLGEALVVDAVDAVPDGARIVLVRAGGAALAPEAVARLAGRGVRTIGIDGPSLDPADSTDFPAHRLAAERGLVVVVNLHLEGVPSGRYRFACLPLLVADGDGAPARALLWTC